MTFVRISVFILSYIEGFEKYINVASQDFTRHSKTVQDHDKQDNKRRGNKIVHDRTRPYRKIYAKPKTLKDLKNTSE